MQHSPAPRRAAGGNAGGTAAAATGLQQGFDGVAEAAAAARRAGVAAIAAMQACRTPSTCIVLPWLAVDVIWSSAAAESGVHSLHCAADSVVWRMRGEQPSCTAWAQAARQARVGVPGYATDPDFHAGMGLPNLDMLQRQYAELHARMAGAAALMARHRRGGQ